MSKKAQKAQKAAPQVEVDEDDVDTTEVETDGGAAEEGDAEPKAPGKNRIILTVPAKHVSGLSGEVPRSDYIRKRFTEDKVSRGTIAKELTKLQGKPVPYQIVFAATKGLEGGPAKEAATEEDEGDEA